MKEQHLSKTPFLTFVYISKCNINLLGYFGNSKKRFLWTGLVHMVTIKGDNIQNFYIQGLHPTLLLEDDEILCVCVTMKNTMPTYFPQWTPDDTRIWTKGSKFSHQKKSSHSWAVGRFSQICPHSPEYFHRACYPNIAFCQDSLPMLNQEWNH